MYYELKDDEDINEITINPDLFLKIPNIEIKIITKDNKFFTITKENIFEGTYELINNNYYIDTFTNTIPIETVDEYTINRDDLQIDKILFKLVLDNERLTIENVTQLSEFVDYNSNQYNYIKNKDYFKFSDIPQLTNTKLELESTSNMWRSNL